MAHTQSNYEQFQMQYVILAHYTWHTLEILCYGCIIIIVAKRNVVWLQCNTHTQTRSLASKIIISSSKYYYTNALCATVLYLTTIHFTARYNFITCIRLQLYGNKLPATMEHTANLWSGGDAGSMGVRVSVFMCTFVVFWKLHTRRNIRLHLSSIAFLRLTSIHIYYWL